MGRPRILYHSLVQSGQLGASPIKTGLATAALKDGAGSAEMQIAGAYTGQTDKEFCVEIDSVHNGAGIGQATFRWSDDGGETWQAIGRVTSSSPVLLGDGLYVYWIEGEDDDFVSGDAWYFKALVPFGPNKAAVWDRDERFRSGGVAGSIRLTWDSEVNIAKTRITESGDTRTTENDGTRITEGE
ncbi:MAG: hypothetical protein KKB20_26200 [Proteobacteria bacterium]|nr:hypothetical protein [Pseudomonadota bacterium]